MRYNKSLSSDFRGINSNTDDLLRATGDTLASAGGEKGSAPNLVTMPVMVQTSTVMGTGRAVGTCVDAAAHSEGSPEITTLGSAIAQCSGQPTHQRARQRTNPRRVQRTNSSAS